jgi:hypothetical protein
MAGAKCSLTALHVAAPPPVLACATRNRRRETTMWNSFNHFLRSRKMLRAMKMERLDRIHSLLKEDPKLAKVRDDERGTPVVWVMHLLKRSESRSGMEFSDFIRIDLGREVWTQQFSAIPYAFQHEEDSRIEQDKIMQMATQLLEAGADVNGTDGKVPLVDAVSLGEEWLVQYLLSNGANVVMPDREGNTALKMAVASVKIQQEIAEMLGHDRMGLLERRQRIVTLLQEAVAKLGR